MNENINILIIVMKKFSKMNYGIASRTECIIDKEILDIKKVFRVRVWNVQFVVDITDGVFHEIGIKDLYKAVFF
jgi:hypothetical protein